MMVKQGGKLHKNRAHTETSHRKLKLSLGFGQGYVYGGIWLPHFKGGGGNNHVSQGKN